MLRISSRMLAGALAAAGLLQLGACGRSAAEAKAEPAAASVEARPRPPEVETEASRPPEADRRLEADLDTIEDRLSARQQPTAAASTPSAPAQTVTQADPASAPMPSASGLQVTRLLVATGVSQREPVGEASEFTASETRRLFAFVELDNPERQQTQVEVAWVDLSTGQEHRPYTLEVANHKRWRTWARAVAPKSAGSWAVVVKDEAGTELARTPFAMVDKHEAL